MAWDWMEIILENRELEPEGLDLALQKLKELPGQRARAFEAEVYYWKAEVAPPNQKLNLYAAAVERAKLGFSETMTEVYLPFWLATNLGLLGQERGILSSLFLLPEIEFNIRLSLQLDETYFFGAPHRALGWLLHKVPSWPISWGDSKKGYQHLLKAIELGDSFPLNYLYAGEVAITIGKKQEGIAYLQKVEDWPLNGKHDKENQVYKARASAILDKFKN